MVDLDLKVLPSFHPFYYSDGNFAASYLEVIDQICRQEFARTSPCLVRGHVACDFVSEPAKTTRASLHLRLAPGKVVDFRQRFRRTNRQVAPSKNLLVQRDTPEPMDFLNLLAANDENILVTKKWQFFGAMTSTLTV